MPIRCNWLVPIPRMLRKPFQNRSGFPHRDLPGARRGGIAKKPSLGECANSPPQVRRCIEPRPHQSMMDMVPGSQRDQHIHIEKVPRSLRQIGPQKPPSPSPVSVPRQSPQSPGIHARFSSAARNHRLTPARVRHAAIIRSMHWITRSLLRLHKQKRSYRHPDQD